MSAYHGLTTTYGGIPMENHNICHNCGSSDYYSVILDGLRYCADCAAEHADKAAAA